MRTIVLSALVLVITLFQATEIRAQESAKQNYVVLTKKVPQLQPILLTAEKLKQEDGEHFGAFEVIICGQEIGDITDPSKIDAFIEKAEALGVNLIACGFSLNKFKVDRGAVPKMMEVVENGILYNFQLQKKGYHSLGL